MLDDIARERDQAIEGVQRGIAELNELYKDCEIKVNEQAPKINEKCDNLEKSSTRTKKGLGHLEDAERIENGDWSWRDLI